MTFKVGDQVRMLVDRVPNTTVELPDETFGTIRSCREPAPLDNRTGCKFKWYVEVELQKPSRTHQWFFSDGDFEATDAHHPLPEPEMSLDEIEQAQEIFQQVRER